MRRATALITDWTMPACRRSRTSSLLQGLSSRFDLHQLPGVNDHLQFMMMRARCGSREKGQRCADRSPATSSPFSRCSSISSKRTAIRRTNKWLCATGLVLHRSCFACIRAGFDHTSSGAGLYDGWLRKFALAPQIGAGRKFFSRLVLRAFVTYAN